MNLINFVVVTSIGNLVLQFTYTLDHGFSTKQTNDPSVGLRINKMCCDKIERKIKYANDSKVKNINNIEYCTAS